MVEIPVYKSQTQPTSEAPGQPTRLPDVTSAAMAPALALKDVANTATDIATQFYSAQVSLQRKTDVTNAMDSILEDYNQLKLDQSNNPDTANALQLFKDGSNKLAQNARNSLSDKVSQQIFDMKFQEFNSGHTLDVQTKVEQNRITNAVTAYDKDIEQLNYDYIYGNSNQALKAIQRLSDPENSVFHDMAKLGLLKVKPEVAQEAALQNLYTQFAEKLVEDTPRNFLFKLNKGFWKDKLPLEKIVDFEKIARSNIESGIKNSQTTLKAELRSNKTLFLEIGNSFLDVESAEYFGSYSKYEELKQDGQVLVEHLRSIGLEKEAFEVNEFLMKMEGQKAVHDQVNTYKMSNIDVVDAKLAELKTINALTTGSDNFDSRNEDLQIALQKISDAQHKHIKSGTMLEYIKSVGMPIPEIDWMSTDANTFAQQIKDYNFFVNQVAAIWDLPEPQFFQEKDFALIKDTFDTGTKEEILTLSGNIAQVAGSQSPSAFSKLTKEFPLFTQAGLLMHMNGGRTTPAIDSIVNAHVLLRDETNQNIIATLDIDSRENTELRQVMESSIGNAFDKMPNTSTQIKEAAKYILYDFVLRDNDLRGKLAKDQLKSGDITKLKKIYSKSIQMAAGMNEWGYGGIEKFNGVNIIVPPMHLNGTLDSFEGLDNNTLHGEDAPSIEDLMTFMDADLFDEATRKVEWQFAAGGSFQSFHSDPIWLDGEQRNASFDEVIGDYESIYLESSPLLGSYYISFGSPQDFGHEYYLNRNENKVVLNISRIHHKLLEKWKAANPNE